MYLEEMELRFGKVEGEATFTNKETINVTGGAGANVGKGNFNNDGTIECSWRKRVIYNRRKSN